MTHNIGCLSMIANDPVQGVPIPIRLLYPTRAVGHAEQFGPYEMNVAVNATAEGEQLSLVIFSHGDGGSSLTYRDLATYLVRAGFAAVLLEHPGNNRVDNSLEGTVANLENRPRHIRAALDAAFANHIIGHCLSRNKIALIGHSMGGYTALAIVGGCPIAGLHETGTGQIEKITVLPDPRISSIVLLAPACGWFNYTGSLVNVDVPILLMTAEKDELASHLKAEIVKSEVRDPGKVDVRMVPNAGHHSFQSPFPSSMARPEFLPSQDPEGFDRVAFQRVMHSEILSFLLSHQCDI